MRFIEFLSEKKANIPQTSKSASYLLKSKNIKGIGSGAQAIAYVHKKFPNKVIKTIQITGENDPVYQFSRVCLNHKDNPFLPHVYFAKQYSSEYVSRDDFQQYLPSDITQFSFPPMKEAYTLIVVTEKLDPIHELPNTDIAKLSIDLGLVTEEEVNYHGIYNILVIIERNLKNNKRREKILIDTNSKYLKEFIRLAGVLNRHFSFDLGSDNYMYRKTEHGPEIVFNDPFTRK